MNSSREVKRIQATGPEMIVLEPGQPAPAGYVLVRTLPTRVDMNGTPYTLQMHDFFNQPPVVGLVSCRQGRHGVITDFRLSDGKTRSMYVTLGELGSSALAALAAGDRSRLANHLSAEGGAA